MMDERMKREQMFGGGWQKQWKISDTALRKP